MGSYAECWASNFYVESTKNDVDPSLMQLFCSSDKKVITANEANLPHQLSRRVRYGVDDEDDIENEDDINFVFYSTSAKIVKDRLELIGYSLANAKKVYLHSLECEISKYEKWIEGSHGDVFQSTLKILHSMSLDKWLTALKEINTKGLTQISRMEELYGESLIQNNVMDNNDGSLISYMLKHDWYGFPGADLNVALRLVFEIIPADEDFVYDVTDLISSGYFDIEDDLVEYARNISSQDYYNSGKRIILTEGKSDTLILSESLKLLYPHLSDYFTFMDFDGAKVGGGAGSLANMVKSFSGAGIINKVIAVFDNDTAAHAALKGLQKAKISNNIKVFTLPEIEILNDYPTIGPSGMVNMNVNGLAGSIEPYLGKSVLTDDEGNLYPIQWTGLDQGLQKYQGEITEKDKVQSNFKEQLKACQEDNLLIDNYDWSGIKTILEGIFNLFHEDDGRQIISWAEEYYR
jgi:HEPN/Toprim N-terminal domain 1